MTQAAGIAKIFTGMAEAVARPARTETPSRDSGKDTCQPQDIGNEATADTQKTVASQTSGEEKKTAPFLTVLNDKIKKEQTKRSDGEQRPSEDKQEEQTAVPAEVLLAQAVVDVVLMNTPPKTDPSLQGTQEAETQSSESPILPKIGSGPEKTPLLSKQSASDISASSRSSAAAEVPAKNAPIPAKNVEQADTPFHSAEIAANRKKPVSELDNPSKNTKETQRPKAAEGPVPPAVMENRPSAGSPHPEPDPITPKITFTQPPAASKTPLETSEPAMTTEELDTKQKKTKSSSISASLSEPSFGKKNVSTSDSFDSIAETARPQSSPETNANSVSTRSTISFRSTPIKETGTSSDLNTPLSASQQVLRNLQNAVQNDIQTIQITLAPAGLGAVRIQLDKIGEEISGVLEVQKPETRQEIEKALPNIIASLDSQGIQVRKIDISQMPNQDQQQRQFSPENAGDWALRYEMSEGRQHRSGGTGTASPQEEPMEEKMLSEETKRTYQSHPESKLLNLFI